MRKSKTNGVAGNCCCLVPVLILLAIFVAALIGAAFVSHHPGLMQCEESCCGTGAERR